LATWLVVMGVAGCGKSSLGRGVAEQCALPLIEGDDFHSPESVSKMRAGNALTDEDRAGWLNALAAELARHSQGAVLTCSALKRSYRDRLRTSVPGLRFVFLDLDRATAHSRVSARAEHFFPASIVDSQFATLEPPTGEPGVLRVDAREDPKSLCAQVCAWLAGPP
jgi:gluconokinase